MFGSYFESHFLWAFAAAILLFVCSLISLQLKRHQLPLLFLMLAAAVLAGCAVTFDDYLHIWDEAFHALVAKNLLKHPLKPTLFEFHVIHDLPPSWASDHVWLHKQPLFLWQIALSFAIFGIDEFTVRIPSAVMFVLMIPMYYRSGTLLRDRTTGFVAASLLFGFSYAYQLISGAFLTDQNDVAFFFYVSASIWSLLEYSRSKKWQWLVALGAFCGAAVLVKWLAGLLAIGGLGLYLILERRSVITAVRQSSIALLAAMIVFLPWQIFAATNYPDVYFREMALNSRHFFEVVESHGGDWRYHFMQFPEMYGPLWIAMLAMIPAFILRKSLFRNNMVIILWVLIFVVYLFFTLAATKMPSFTLIAAMPLFLLTGLAWSHLLEKISIRYIGILYSSALFIIVIAGLRFENLQLYHTDWMKPQKDWRHDGIHKRKIFEKFAADHPEPTVGFNLKYFDSTYLQFYTNSIGYGFFPSYEDKERIKKDYKVIVFKFGNEEIPDYLVNDPDVEIRTDLYP
jgi:4-amino-4-deoxy-L-arabinose transferase-like glycosyltransferase